MYGCQISLLFAAGAESWAERADVPTAPRSKDSLPPPPHTKHLQRVYSTSHRKWRLQARTRQQARSQCCMHIVSLRTCAAFSAVQVQCSCIGPNGILKNRAVALLKMLPPLNRHGLQMIGASYSKHRLCREPRTNTFITYEPDIVADMRQLAREDISRGNVQFLLLSYSVVLIQVIKHS